MSKVDYRGIPLGERRKMVQELAQMLLAVKGERDMMEVLYRLLTPSEQIMLGRRKQVAEMLVEGATYASIQKKLRVGVPTIRNIEKWLEDAVRDFDIIRSKRQRERRDKEFKEGSRQRREGVVYTGPFLLLNLLLDSPVRSK